MPNPYNYGGGNAFDPGAGNYVNNDWKRNIQYTFGQDTIPQSAFVNAPSFAPQTGSQIQGAAGAGTNPLVYSLNVGTTGPGSGGFAQWIAAGHRADDQANQSAMAQNAQERQGAIQHGYDMQLEQMRIAEEERARQAALYSNLMQDRYSQYLRYGR